LLDRIRKAMATESLRYEIAVIDGRSEDATAEIARSQGCRLVAQGSPGHGEALRLAFREGRGEHLAVMDADHSHPPELLPGMVRQRHATDLVMASRYVPGGSSADVAHRRILSWLLNRVFRLFLGLPYGDCSSGFRLYRRSALDGVLIRARHIDIQQEVLFRLHRRGLRIVEIPFRFESRRSGRSSVNVRRVAVHLSRTLLRLTVERWRRPEPAAR
jgi:dolichol-phosphate mannosyltransferase